jgi:hypothetical protein
MSDAEDQEEHFEGQDIPHFMNMSGSEDQEEDFKGQDIPHSKNMSGAEDPKERFEGQEARTRGICAVLKTQNSALRDKKAAFEEYERC